MAAPGWSSLPRLPTLQGIRVLVVEDELLVAMLIEETLTDHGCTVHGPHSTVASALAAACHAEIDVAVLDVNLRGERVYPVAEVLAARNIPFLLLSGYGRDGVPAEHQDWIAFAKPFLPSDLVRALAGLVVASPAA